MQLLCDPGNCTGTLLTPTLASCSSMSKVFFSLLPSPRLLPIIPGCGEKRNLSSEIIPCLRAVLPSVLLYCVMQLNAENEKGIDVTVGHCCVVCSLLLWSSCTPIQQLIPEVFIPLGNTKMKSMDVATHPGNGLLFLRTRFQVEMMLHFATTVTYPICLGWSTSVRTHFDQNVSLFFSSTSEMVLTRSATRANVIPRLFALLAITGAASQGLGYQLKSYFACDQDANPRRQMMQELLAEQPQLKALLVRVYFNEVFHLPGEGLVLFRLFSVWKRRLASLPHSLEFTGLRRLQFKLCDEKGFSSCVFSCGRAAFQNRNFLFSLTLLSPFFF